MNEEVTDRVAEGLRAVLAPDIERFFNASWVRLSNTGNAFNVYRYETDKAWLKLVQNYDLVYMEVTAKAEVVEKEEREPTPIFGTSAFIAHETNKGITIQDNRSEPWEDNAFFNHYYYGIAILTQDIGMDGYDPDRSYQFFNWSDFRGTGVQFLEPDYSVYDWLNPDLKSGWAVDMDWLYQEYGITELVMNVRLYFDYVPYWEVWQRVTYLHAQTWGFENYEEAHPVNFIPDVNYGEDPRDYDYGYQTPQMARTDPETPPIQPYASFTNPRRDGPWNVYINNSPWNADSEYRPREPYPYTSKYYIPGTPEWYKYDDDDDYAVVKYPSQAQVEAANAGKEFMYKRWRYFEWFDAVFGYKDCNLCPPSTAGYMQITAHDHWEGHYNKNEIRTYPDWVIDYWDWQKDVTISYETYFVPGYKPMERELVYRPDDRFDGWRKSQVYTEDFLNDVTDSETQGIAIPGTSGVLTYPPILKSSTWDRMNEYSPGLTVEDSFDVILRFTGNGVVIEEIFLVDQYEGYPSDKVWEWLSANDLV